MKVELTRITKDPILAIEEAASNCYNSKPTSDGKIMKHCIKSGHTSVTEFCDFTFHIEGVSRALSHQLVRHRIASYAQRSQRYCNEADFTLTEDEIYNPLHLQAFWNGVEIMPGAKEGIQKLLSEGHEIYIVTSAHPDTIKWKAEWLQREFPEIPWSHVIVANNKSLVKGDVLVDDGIHNLYEGSCIKVLFDKPWNRNVDMSKLTDIIHRVHHWDEIVRLIEEFNARK